ncbi:putative exocyst complex component sec8 [Wickerhamiella sorbophila]|uniref:Exocyst complex component Sec8 n=1 Tax=Wickerhamiella sorbophila TaxID=45607 RepID=A0A2T0FNC9_9ASCO|nr:putative exocyst complex component sec8 [Wickerhamiella sorbophila]PRT56503.1 putative exocyst complex component sec8 [Wickerhamiella sorbophila]
MKDIDLLLYRVSEHFNELLDDDANPLEAALALMDESSIGKARYADEFDNLQNEIRTCLKEQVDANYRGFNSSIDNYRAIVNGIHSNHNDIIATQENLKSVGDLLSKRKPMLKDLEQSSLKYKKMLQILDVIEDLKQAPDRYEAQVSQKRFNDAHKTLSHALETINNYDLLRVPAVQHLQSYIVNRQLSLVPTLVEELSAHIYLRSPYTSDRYFHFQMADKSCSSEEAVSDRLHLDTTENVATSKLNDFIGTLSKPLVEDADVSVEQDSFTYIRSLLLTLSKVGAIQSALESLQNKTVSDIRRLVERTVKSVVRQAKITPEKVQALPGTLFEQFRSPEQANHIAVLQGFITTLFSRFGAVLEAHRVIYEVVTQGQLGSYDVRTVWTAMEHEIKQIFVSYVDDGQASRAGGRSWLSVTSESHTVVNGPVFKIAGADTTDHDLIEQMNALKVALKSSVPGLVVNAEENPNEAPLFMDTPKEMHLTIVVPANVLNVRAFIEPAAAFLQRANRTLGPADSSDRCVGRIDAFLDQFLETVFLPRLRQALERSFNDVTKSLNAAEVYQDYRNVSQMPIMNAVVSLVDMLNLLTRVLNTGRTFRENYTSLFVDMMDIVVDFFNTKFNEYVASGPKQTKLAYTLAVGEVLTPLHQTLRTELSGSQPTERASEVSSKELRVYLGKAHSDQNANDIMARDLLDLDSFGGLALLCTSIEWVVYKLREIRQTQASSSGSSSESKALRQRVRKRWTLSDAQTASVKTGVSPNKAVLAGTTLRKFDNVLTTMSNTAVRALRVLRCDVMCRTVYYFDRMVLEGDYSRTEDSEERDSYIEILQREVHTCYRLMIEHLPRTDSVFVMFGLAALMNELFVHESNNVKSFSERGLRKMFSNILSLQQMLKSVAFDPRDVDFSRAVDFYEALKLPPTRIIELVRSKKTRLTREDAQLVLSIKHRQDLAKKSSSELSSAHQVFSDQLAMLHSIFGGK